jgi:hypothetical protein
VTEAVAGGGVDPVDRTLQRVMDRGDRLIVVLRAPAVFPVAAAKRPRAEADARDLQATRTRLALHSI